MSTEAEKAAAEATGMLLALWARELPDAVAIRSPAGDRSFAELNANANRLARALRARGLREDDSIALLCTNRPEFAEVFFAALRTGLRLTPVNWHLTAEEAAYIVQDCEAKAIVADASGGQMAAAAARLASRATARLALGGAIDGFERYEDALAAERGDDIDDPVLGSRMLYTSGTTGKPKGVARPKLYAYTPTTTAASGYDPAKGHVHLCTGPLYHAAPLSFSFAMPLRAGVGVVLMERFDPEQTLALVEKHRVTHTHVVPTMFHRLLGLPEEVRKRYDLSSLRFVIHGAAPCPVATKKAIMDWLGPVVWEYYAATEGSGALVSPQEWLKKPGTVGKPRTADHVQIIGDDGELLPPGAVGTVYLKVVQGAEFEYFKDRDKTTKARRGEHYTLGDVGYLDEDGYLFLTDRSADLIISGGVNIYPAEVEAVLLQHEAVRDAAVIGVPNEEWGEEVRAVVELVPGAETSATELVEFCRARLARFKCPREVDFVAQLPRLDSGKLYKRKLREEYRARAAERP